MEKTISKSEALKKLFPLACLEMYWHSKLDELFPDGHMDGEFWSFNRLWNGKYDKIWWKDTPNEAEVTTMVKNAAKQLNSKHLDKVWEIVDSIKGLYNHCSPEGDFSWNNQDSFTLSGHLPALAAISGLSYWLQLVEY